MDIKKLEQQENAVENLLSAIDLDEDETAREKLMQMQAANWFLFLITGEQDLATRIVKKFGYLYFSFD